MPVIDNYKIEIFDSIKFDIGSFSIIPFELEHDVYNLGYLIKDNISGYKLLYITDTGMIDQLSFKDIDCFLIESNCDEEELNYENFKQVRLYNTHLSMQQTSKFLINNSNINTKKIILCHISTSEKDYLKHKRYVEEQINNSNIEVIALNPHIKEPLDIVLKEEIDINFD